MCGIIQTNTYSEGELDENKERKHAKRFDTPNRSRNFTDKVYSGPSPDPKKLLKETFATERDFYPDEPEYNIYFGEMHGHTFFSDSLTDVDSYYTNIQDNAKLDFAALTDHDHGGIGKEELYGDVWKEIQAAAKKYYEPGRFTTILGCERGSYPWYNNAVVYFNSHDADILGDSILGEITKAELSEALARKDIILVPHDTYHLEAGADLSKIDPELFTPLIEIYSRGDSAEYFDNPYNECNAQCSGCFWQDAKGVHHFGAICPFKVWENGKLIADLGKHLAWNPFNLNPAMDIKKSKNRMIFKLTRNDVFKFSWSMRNQLDRSKYFYKANNLK